VDRGGLRIFDVAWPGRSVRPRRTGLRAKGYAPMAEDRVPAGNLHHPLIRRYMACDRGAVRRLAVACADPRIAPACLSSHYGLVADVLTRYYLDFEPEACWVADDPVTGVVGYLFGCLSTARRCRVMASRIVPPVILRAFLSGVVFSCPLGRLAWAGLRTWTSRHTVKTRATRAYPAHLHVGMREDYRRSGLGRELVLRFVEQVRDEGIAGIHVSVVRANLPARMFFRDVGFDVLEKYEVILPGSPQSPVQMLLLGQQVSVQGGLRRGRGSSRAKGAGE